MSPRDHSQASSLKRCPKMPIAKENSISFPSVEGKRNSKVWLKKKSVMSFKIGILSDFQLKFIKPTKFKSPPCEKRGLEITQ